MSEQTKTEEISKTLMESISNFETPNNERTKFRTHKDLTNLIKEKGCSVNQSEISKHLSKLGIYKSKDGYYTAPVKSIASPRFIEFADLLVLNQVNFEVELDNPEAKMLILSIDPKFSSLLMDSFKHLFEDNLKVFLFPNTNGELLIIYNSRREKNITNFPKITKKLSAYIKNRNEALR